jgi:hypothetical protein
MDFFSSRNFAKKNRRRQAAESFRNAAAFNGTKKAGSTAGLLEG